MTASINDRNALLAVSPMALSAYARAAGWTKADAYGDHSDVYAGPSLPEIIIPRTRRLGDYAPVVAQLISIFAQTAEISETALYNDLVIADRDAVRARVSDGAADGSVDLNSGVSLVAGIRDTLLATACSLRNPRPLYRTGANQEANDLLRQMRLGQTEHGSFVVTLLTPAIPPPPLEPRLPDPATDPAPLARQVTRRLDKALDAARRAAEMASGGDASIFPKAVQSGVSANLCEALVNLIEPTGMLDISITWARTLPMPTARQTFNFTSYDAPILRAAAQSFHSREPQPDVELFGSVQTLRRDESESDGAVTIRASVDGVVRSVRAVLTQSDYARAIRAHEQRWPVVVTGDLERTGQRWHLHGPRLVTVISDADDPDEAA